MSIGNGERDSFAFFSRPNVYMVFYNTIQEGKTHSICYMMKQRKVLNTSSYSAGGTDLGQDSMPVDP